MKRAALVLAMGIAFAGCYLSHQRPDGEDAGGEHDDAAPDAGSPDAFVLETGCRARCDEPELVALANLSDQAPRVLVEAQSIGDAIVVLATRPSLGHIAPAHRAIVFEPSTGALTVSEPWVGTGPFAQHVDGVRFVPSRPGHVRALALAGRPELDGTMFPTGRQWVSVHLVDWALDGGAPTARALSQFPGAPTEGCPGGCEAGITVDGEHAVVSYAPAGVLSALEIELGDEAQAGAWTELGPVDDPRIAPWPHVAAVARGERWIAGGGTFDLEPARRGWLIGGGEQRALPGGDDDPSPMLLGGDALILARYIGVEHAFRVERVGGATVAIPTGGGPAPLASHLSRTSAGRVLIAWSSYAPGSLRDTVVNLSPDVPEHLCTELEAAPVVRIPEAVSHPSVLAHEHRGVIYLFALPNDATGRHPQIAVFAIRGCALVP